MYRKIGGAMVTLLFVAMLAACGGDGGYEYEEQAQTWQAAYASLLAWYAEQPLGEHYGNIGGFFMLVDFGGNAPVLIVADRFHFTSYFAAYAFDEALVPLAADYFYDYATIFFAATLPDERRGLGMESNEGIWNSAAVLVLDGNALVPEISLRRMETWDENGPTTRWSLNGEYITEYEHDRLHAEIFGNAWHERIEWHRIDGGNIDNALALTADN